MEREWGNGERFTLNISSFSVKNCHILSQNVKYGTFVANVTKISTYALWGNNSGSNLLRGSSAICAGLCSGILKAYQTFFNLINIQICSRILTYCFLSISTMCKVFWISPNLARDMSLPRTQNFKILQVPVCYRTWVYLHRHLQIPKSVAIVEASLTTGGLGKSFLWPSKQHPADLCNVFDVKIVSIKSQMS